MEPREILSSAWKSVQEADLPEELHQVAFVEAVRLFSSNSKHGNGSSEKLSVAASSSADLSSSEDRLEIDTESLMSQFARETDCEVSQLERVVYFQDGIPTVTAPKSRLGTTLAQQARNVALVITAARHYALDEPEVAIDVVRVACLSSKCYDRPNFNRHMGQVPGVNLIGPPKAKLLKPKSDIVVKLRDFLDKMTESRL